MELLELGNILRHFRLPSPISTERISAGLINQTHLVETANRSYIVQKLNPIITPEICGDGHTISDYLKTQGISAPQYFLSEIGLPYFETEEGLWRVLEKLLGKSLDAPSSSHAYKAAALLGKIHTSLRSFSYSCKGKPDFHNVQKIREELIEVSTKKYQENLEEAKKLSELTLKWIEKETLPKDVPKQLIHGDPKFSNFLFEGERETGLIDFDTFTSHSPLIDVGDMMRSWCNSTPKENPQAKFEKEIYQAITEGYKTTNPQFSEMTLIPRAFRLLVLEQTMRYLKDCFEDKYYPWDPQKFPSRLVRNSTYAKRHIDLYRQIEGL